jgi:hypothetical protein
MIKVSDLAPIFRKFTDNTGIVITESAQHPIVELINCVEVDPHETWQPQKNRFKKYYEQCSEILPDILVTIAKEHRLTKRITTIDIFHWTGNNLSNLNFSEVKLCFPNPNEIPPTPMMVFPWNLERGQSKLKGKVVRNIAVRTATAKKAR